MDFLQSATDLESPMPAGCQLVRNAGAGHSLRSAGDRMCLHPVLLKVREELKGVIGALIIPLRLLAVLAFGGCTGCWVGFSLGSFLRQGLSFLCWGPSCLATFSCLPCHGPG